MLNEDENNRYSQNAQSSKNNNAKKFRSSQIHYHKMTGIERRNKKLAESFGA
jgi:hypothetical protein